MENTFEEDAFTKLTLLHRDIKKLTATTRASHAMFTAIADEVVPIHQKMPEQLTEFLPSRTFSHHKQAHTPKEPKNRRALRVARVLIKLQLAEMMQDVPEQDTESTAVLANTIRNLRNAQEGKVHELLKNYLKLDVNSEISKLFSKKDWNVLLMKQIEQDLEDFRAKMVSKSSHSGRTGHSSSQVNTQQLDCGFDMVPGSVKMVTDMVDIGLCREPAILKKSNGDDVFDGSIQTPTTSNQKVATFSADLDQLFSSEEDAFKFGGCESPMLY